MNGEGKPVLCDFGLSRIRHEATRNLSLIQEGGTPRYLAPELSIGPLHFRTNEASDVYSLGMTFFALATQTLPFSALTDKAAERAAEIKQRPNPRTSYVSLPENCAQLLWRLMGKMWDHDPESRPLAALVAEEMSWIAWLTVKELDTGTSALINS